MTKIMLNNLAASPASICPNLFMYLQVCTTRTGDFKRREVKTGFFRNRKMKTGSSGTLIGWKSGQTTFVPLWNRMEGAWLWTASGILLCSCKILLNLADNTFFM
jgi:hypothetical protein